MSFIHKYPYTDFHELNADWLIEKITKVEASIDGIKESIEDEMKEWVKGELKPYTDRLDALILEVNNLEDTVDGKLAELDAEVDRFEAEVNAKITLIQQNISAQISAVNQLTDTKIAANNEVLMERITSELGSVVTVVNPFTGARVTIQAMVDVLASFHIEDALDYATMNSRAKTYTQFNALNISYTDLLLHGGSLYV